MKKLIIITCTLFLFIGCTNNNDNREELNSKLKDYAEEFYLNNLKGQVDHLDEVTIDLAVLENQDYDISMFKSYKTNKACDKEETYAVIVLKFDKEKNPNKDYLIDTYLECGYDEK